MSKLVRLGGLSGRDEEGGTRVSRGEELGEGGFGGMWFLERSGGVGSGRRAGRSVFARFESSATGAEFWWVRDGLRAVRWEWMKKQARGRPMEWAIEILVEVDKMDIWVVRWDSRAESSGILDWKWCSGERRGSVKGVINWERPWYCRS